MVSAASSAARLPPGGGSGVNWTSSLCFVQHVGDSPEGGTEVGRAGGSRESRCGIAGWQANSVWGEGRDLAVSLGNIGLSFMRPEWSHIV